MSSGRLDDEVYDGVVASMGTMMCCSVDEHQRFHAIADFGNLLL